MTSSSRLVTAVRLLALLTLLLGHAVPASAQSAPTSEGERQLQELRRIYKERRQALREGREEIGEDIFGRDAWFHYQRSFPYGQIPAGARVEALRATAELERSLERSWLNNGRERSLFSTTLWEPIGPTNQGGRIRAVAMHPVNHGEFLVGAAAGGVWRTTDGGETWMPTFDRESAMAIGSIAYDQSNPSIVYAGTGESFPSSPTLLINTPSYFGNGIFKSTDGGLTWRGLGLESAGAVTRLFVNRQNPSIVYASVSRENGGFYRSTDAGETWTRTVTGDFFDMAVNPLNGEEVYLGHATGVQRSTDGGRTFTWARNGMSGDGGVRFSVSVSAAAPDVVWALGARRSGQSEIGEVYRSSDKGVSWTLVESFPTTFFNGQGIYDQFITAHPARAGVVLVGGIDVFRSTDNGANWTNTTRSYSGGSTHPDQHTAEFAPTNPDVAVLGNDGGIYVSLNGGATWSHQSNGLAVTQFYRMEVDQSRPFRVYGGTQDNGTSGSFGTSGYTGDWRHVLGGDGFFVQTDLSDPNWFYGEVYYGALFRINGNNPDQKSRVDWGIPTSGAEADEGNWATPIAMSEADRKSLYSGRTNLWRTTDRGATWKKIPVGISTKLASIGLSPFDANKIVVGSIGGHMRYSTDYGATWGAATGVPSSVVTDIQFDPVDPNRVYATYSGFGGARVFRSQDNGATWQDITANIPAVPVNAIEIDPANTQHLFVGTDVGAWFSPNGGDFWIPFNPGLPLAPVSDLRIHRTSRSLIAATHGRSMFRVSIDDIRVEPTLVYPIGGERITTPGELVVQWYGFEGPVNVSIRYSADEPFQIVAANVVDGRATLALPMRQSTTARVRVEEAASGRTVSSGFVTLVTPANATTLGRRGFAAEAIELRGATLWATSRTSDTIMRLRLPLLTGASPIVRSGFGGRIRDLAYDSLRDEFLALVADDDFSSPRIHRMDTNGAHVGELALPAELTSAVGIAVHDTHLAVMSESPTPTLWLLDPATGEERSRSSIADAGGAIRRGLVWNGRSYVQGAIGEGSSTGFDSELQQISGSVPARVFERVPIVVSTGSEVTFVGLAHDPGSAGTSYYYATDTSGMFFRFRADILGSVGSGTIGDGSISAVNRASIMPNPAQRQAALELEVAASSDLAIAIVDAGGRPVAALAQRRFERGTHSVALPLEGIASGVYFVVVESASDRLVRPLTVVR